MLTDSTGSRRFDLVSLATTVRNLVARALHRRKRSYFKKRGVSEQSVEAKFTWIFRNRYWGEGESLSGTGSTLEQTQAIRRELPKLLAAYEVRTFFDAPCGDLNWMSALLPELSAHYIGGDIVADLIDQLNEEHAGERVSFRHVDIIKDPLPAADMMMCRDCLFHFSYADTQGFLRNFLRSGIPCLLTTSHVNTDGFANRDIATGLFRRIDLFKPPYCFPANPLAQFDDWAPPEAERRMYLWSRDQVQAALATFDR